MSQTGVTATQESEFQPLTSALAIVKTSARLVIKSLGCCVAQVDGGAVCREYDGRRR